MSMQSLFYPKAAVVYGSMAEGKLGNVLVQRLLEGGFADVYAVNPKAQGAFSAPGFKAACEIGRPIDLAVIASPAPTVKEVLVDCGQAGIKASIIITSGFSEAGNCSGEEEIIDVARKNKIRFVGPNCAGILNTHHRLYPTLETAPPTGETALVSQSGALGGAILSWAAEQGLGFSKFVSYGNGADLDEVDFLEYFIDDPSTRVLALYLESVKDGRRFMRAVDQFTRKKPLVVIKAGRTQSGQRAALSHTGSMAGSDSIFDSVLLQCGAVRVNDVEEMFDLCKGFTYVPPVKGRKVIIVTNSGGPGVLAADRAEAVGLNVSEISAHQREKLTTFLPAHCGMKNPVDLTVEGTGEGYYQTLVTLLDEYDAALAVNVGTPSLDSIPLAGGVCRALRQTGKPILANFMAGTTVVESLPVLEECGLPNYVTGERAVTTLAHLARYEERKMNRAPLTEITEKQRPLPGSGNLLEHEAMIWLRENGIPTPEFCFAASGSAAVEACRKIGYPVVMKVVSPDILHKSDSGGVILNIGGDSEAERSYAQILQAASGKDFRGVIIYPMVKDAREVLLGLSQDPQFGPVVVFGLGGVYTELWRDISMRVAPVDHAGAESMIGSVRSFPLLKGYRGSEPCDLKALTDLVVNFSRLPFRYPEIAEVDLNPVFLFAKGLLVGDARVIRKNQASLT